MANQNGKQLNRIATDYENDVFTLETAATLDLAGCTTPSGALCQDPNLRPDNAPICPRTTSDGKFTFVTLRGGGMFVVDHNTTPMRIVAEYDRAHVDDNGCGEMEARGKMYVNSGAGLTVPPVPGDEPFGHDVYAVELDRLSRTPNTTPNRPRVEHVYTRDDERRRGGRPRGVPHQGRRLPVVGRPEPERRDRGGSAPRSRRRPLRAGERAQRRPGTGPVRPLAARRLHVRLAARPESRPPDTRPSGPRRASE